MYLPVEATVSSCLQGEPIVDKVRGAYDLQSLIDGKVIAGGSVLHSELGLRPIDLRDVPLLKGGEYKKLNRKGGYKPTWLSLVSQLPSPVLTVSYTSR